MAHEPQDKSIRSNTRRYRFGIILSTSLGNMTRYNNFRKFAERDPDVDFVWAPVKHYFAPHEKNPFRHLPGFIQKRAIVLYQGLPVLRRLRSLDAVMLHLYEADVITALRGYLFSSPLRVISSDDAPASDPSRYPFHPVDLQKPAWRRALRLKVDVWRARRSHLLIPFSRWAGDLLVNGAGVDRERVIPIHVGLDLDIWRYEPKKRDHPNHRVKILFVGGEFFRKGGADLLEACSGRLSQLVELHVVTKTVIDDIPKHVNVHSDLVSNDVRLTLLYQQAEILVHPTRSDLSSWVVLEAMASGCAVITTRIGGIADLVEEDETGIFVPVGDCAALEDAIENLVIDPSLRYRMGIRARQVIEEKFNAEVNVPLILQAMKNAVDARGL